MSRADVVEAGVKALGFEVAHERKSDRLDFADVFVSTAGTEIGKAYDAGRASVATLLHRALATLREQRGAPKPKVIEAEIVALLKEVQP